MQPRPPKDAGLTEALAVAEGKALPTLTEADGKVLGLLLHDGECTAEISESEFTVWYSWLDQRRPSTYFISLAPGVIGRLMQLGGVERIDDKVTFRLGAGTTGIGRYAVEFSKKWVRIRLEPDRILILIRNTRCGLSREMSRFVGVAARCERCNGELRTPLAKQCLNCGYDWH